MIVWERGEGFIGYQTFDFVGKRRGTCFNEETECLLVGEIKDCSIAFWKY